MRKTSSLLLIIMFSTILWLTQGYCTRSSQYEFESNHYAGPLVHIVCCSTPSIMLFSSDYWLPTTSCPPHSNIDCFTNVFPCGVWMLGMLCWLTGIMTKNPNIFLVETRTLNDIKFKKSYEQQLNIEKKCSLNPYVFERLEYRVRSKDS